MAQWIQWMQELFWHTFILERFLINRKTADQLKDLELKRSTGRSSIRRENIHPITAIPKWQEPSRWVLQEAEGLWFTAIELPSPPTFQSASTRKEWVVTLPHVCIACNWIIQILLRKRWGIPRFWRRCVQNSYLCRDIQSGFEWNIQHFKCNKNESLETWGRLYYNVKGGLSDWPLTRANECSWSHLRSKKKPVKWKQQEVSF